MLKWYHQHIHSYGTLWPIRTMNLPRLSLQHSTQDRKKKSTGSNTRLSHVSPRCVPSASHVYEQSFNFNNCNRQVPQVDTRGKDIVRREDEPECVGLCMTSPLGTKNAKFRVTWQVWNSFEGSIDDGGTILGRDMQNFWESFIATSAHDLPC